MENKHVSEEVTSKVWPLSTIYIITLKLARKGGGVR